MTVDTRAAALHDPRSVGDVSLEQVLARASSGLPVPIGCWVIARAAEALASAPRAITPAEVRIDVSGEVRITPPGLARTPFQYIAPEVIRGGDPDARSAVFGLGALLAEIVSGRSPFARESDLATRLAVTDDPSPALAGKVPDATHELDAMLARALAKDPAQRFASTAELAARIDAFLSDELHDVGREQVAAATRAALDGADPNEALFARRFAPPEHGAALGEPKLQVPLNAPVTDPAPSGVTQPRRPTPPPGVVEPARRSPGVVAP